MRSPAVLAALTAASLASAFVPPPPGAAVVDRAGASAGPGPGPFSELGSPRGNGGVVGPCGGTACTALQMGFRSFIKRKVLRKKDGSDNNSPDDPPGKGKKRGKAVPPIESGKSDDASAGEGGEDDDDAATSPPSSSTAASSSASPSSSSSSRPIVPPRDGSAIPHTLVETFGKKPSEGGEGGSQSSPSKGKSPDGAPSSGKNNPIRQSLPEGPSTLSEESVQDRIARVKSGRMSEEEKRAFLRSALLSDPLPKAGDGLGGRPIRMPLPDDAEAGFGTAEGLERSIQEQRQDNTAGPGAKGHVPSGPLWSSIVGTPAAAPSGTGGGGGGRGGSWRVPVSKALDEDEKKRYLDQVMNPERFRTYGYRAGSGGGGEDADDADADYEEPDVTDTMDEDLDMAAASRDDPAADYDADDDEDGDASSSNATEPTSGGSGSKGGIFSKVSDNLASRLEAAAHAKEKAAREAREKAEADRVAAAKRREEEFNARQLELKRKLEEDRERKRAEEERLRAEREEEERAERERLEAMQRKQDDYWKEKLEKERKRREAEVLAEKEREEETEKLERRGREEVGRALIREEERSREDPHEGDILKEAEEDRIHNRELTRSIMDKSAARAGSTATPPPPGDDDVSVSSFVSEQQRKKAEIDRIVKEQRERLRSLNSPLPTPGAPPQTVAPSPAPEMRTPSSARSLAELSSLINDDVKGANVPASPPPAPAPSAPLPSLAEMTRLKKDDGGGGASTPQPPRLSLSEMTRLKKDQPAHPPAPPASQTPSLADMTRLKKDGPAGGVAVGGRGGGGQSPASAPPPSRKRVVRQQLPLGDDDETDYDGDDYLRNGPNSGMSIGDVMKKIGKKSSTEGLSDGDKKEAEKNKARMWGIDMDKYK